MSFWKYSIILIVIVVNENKEAFDDILEVIHFLLYHAITFIHIKSILFNSYGDITFLWCYTITFNASLLSCTYLKYITP